MNEEDTFDDWKAHFLSNIERRNRYTAFNLLELMRGRGQYPPNRLNDEEVEIWFEMLAVFNQTFPDNPAFFPD